MDSTIQIAAVEPPSGLPLLRKRLEAIRAQLTCGNVANDLAWEYALSEVAEFHFVPSDNGKNGKNGLGEQILDLCYDILDGP